MIMLFTIILFAITSLFIQNPEINIVLLSNLHPFHSVSQSDRQTAISAPYSLSLYTNNFKDIPFFPWTGCRLKVQRRQGDKYKKYKLRNLYPFVSNPISKWHPDTIQQRMNAIINVDDVISKWNLFKHKIRTCCLRCYIANYIMILCFMCCYYNYAYNQMHVIIILISFYLFIL